MSAKRPGKDAAQRDIDDKIRQMYQETVQEELPDRFRDLLAKLKQQGKSE